MMSLGNDIRFLFSKERRHSEGLLFLLVLELGLGLVGLRKWWIFFCALSSRDFWNYERLSSVFFRIVLCLVVWERRVGVQVATDFSN